MTEGTAHKKTQFDPSVLMYFWQWITAASGMCSRTAEAALHPVNSQRAQGHPGSFEQGITWVSETFCASPWWSPSRWHLLSQHLGHCEELWLVQLSSPQLFHSLQKTHLGHGLASSSRSWADRAAKSLLPAAGCQAPVHSKALPTLNGRKRWCVGNTQCCRSRGLWQRAHPVPCSLAMGRLL